MQGARGCTCASRRLVAGHAATVRTKTRLMPHVPTIRRSRTKANEPPCMSNETQQLLTLRENRLLGVLAEEVGGMLGVHAVGAPHGRRRALGHTPAERLHLCLGGKLWARQLKRVLHAAVACQCKAQQTSTVSAHACGTCPGQHTGCMRRASGKRTFDVCIGGRCSTTCGRGIRLYTLSSWPSSIGGILLAPSV